MDSGRATAAVDMWVETLSREGCDPNGLGNAALEPLEEACYTRLHICEEAVVATVACLRWGSYPAVLADRDRTLSPQAR